MKYDDEEGTYVSFLKVILVVTVHTHTDPIREGFN